MNQLCKVCGEPAAGFHFGAFTCEGCKSFFGRTYNNISSISECKNNGECVINKKNRTACKACRLRKCLMVGMSKSGSRYGRRSNWFKIHCLLQEQQQAGANIAAAAANLLRPHPYLSSIFRNNVPRDAHSSESDSGASSADPEDYLKATPSDREFTTHKSKPSSDTECFTRRKIASALVNPPSISPASLPSVSPSSVIPKWLPPYQGFGDPSAWRDLWIRESVPMAATAPDQNEPIDLSVKPASNRTPPPPPTPESDNELCIDVGVDEPVKSVPLDLTLDRVTTDISN